MRSCVRSRILAAALLVVAGCDSDRLSTYEVTGKVVFEDGTVLRGGWIVCESVDQGLAARGIVETDGSYRLGTYGADDGVVAGRQLIAITPASPDGYDPDENTAPSPIDRRFMHMDTSGLEIEVDPDSANHFVLVVERPDS